MTPLNRQFILSTRPSGVAKRGDFTFDSVPLRAVKDQEVLIKIHYVSLDPAMRGWMNESRESYMPPVELGEVMRALGVGQIVESRHPDYAVGDYVSGTLGVQDYSWSNGAGLIKVDPALATLPVFLSVLGMPGLTAYFGLLEIGKPRAGDTVVVSGAAGAVGAVVGQIAKIKGARVIGIAGGAEKCRYLIDTLGFDVAIDYKAESVQQALKNHCPNGVDVYFDNVGGEILDNVLSCLAHGARIVICGAISQYNNVGAVVGPANYLSLLVNRASMTGMMVSDYYVRAPEAITAMAGWIAEGKLVTQEDISVGLEHFPEVFAGLFSGANHGKLMLQVSESLIPI